MTAFARKKDSIPWKGLISQTACRGTRNAQTTPSGIPCSYFKWTFWQHLAVPVSGQDPLVRDATGYIGYNQ